MKCLPVSNDCEDTFFTVYIWFKTIVVQPPKVGPGHGNLLMQPFRIEPDQSVTSNIKEILGDKISI